jgi:DNA-binding transcriptional MerR regulator
VSGRSFLSIGDVLSLLRQEFPDVTISKIRFLESQGLVNPERTPSGYRKFYPNDVDRLRWVLRQQREHFLPLKVIKGRLEEEVPDRGDDNGRESDAPGDDASREGAGRPEPMLVGHPAAQGQARPRPSPQETAASRSSRTAAPAGVVRTARLSASSPAPAAGGGAPAGAAAAVASGAPAE